MTTVDRGKSLALKLVDDAGKPRLAKLYWRNGMTWLSARDPSTIPSREMHDITVQCNIDTKLKHIHNKYLRVLELTAEGRITVQHVPSEANYSDVMTKATIPKDAWVEFRRAIMGE